MCVRVGTYVCVCQCFYDSGHVTVSGCFFFFFGMHARIPLVFV